MYIESIGRAVPKYCWKQPVAAELAVRCCAKSTAPIGAFVSAASSNHMNDAPNASARTTSDRVIRRMYELSGIRTRHFAVNDADDDHLFYPPPVHPGDLGPTTAERMREYERHAAPLAIEACEKALSGAAASPDELTHLVTMSCTGFRAPGADVELIRALDLSPTIARTHIGFMGCHAAINGLRVAQAYCAAAPTDAAVLMCAVELSSLHFQYRADRDALVSNAIFADGAAALIGRSISDRSRKAWRVAATASCVFPESEEVMQWIVGDHGFEMILSARVPFLIETHLRAWLEVFLADHDLRVGDIASWAVHPGGPRVLDAVESALQLDSPALDPSRCILADFGNMSSATVLYIVDELQKREYDAPCVALAFGPGLTVEAALLR